MSRSVALKEADRRDLSYIPSGYKRSEVGLIPEQWRAVRIGDLFTFKNGLNKAKQFFGHGTPIVNYMDVFEHPGLSMENVGGRVDVNQRELSAYEVRQGDVFFTRTSETTDEIGIASVMIDAPERTVFSGFILRARPADQSLADRFKAYCFAAQYFRKQVISRASYTTRALTNGRLLSAALLACPPIAEQQAIAEALSDADALIEGLERLIAKKRAIKQGAMQDLLTGKRRLPGFAGEWNTHRIGDVLTIRHGKSQHEVACEDSPFPILATGGQIGWAIRPLYSKPSVLIGRKGTIDRPRYMDTPFWTVDTLFYSEMKGCNDAKFFFYRFWLVDWMRHNEASGVPSLNARTIEALEFAIPQPDEQTAIAAVLSDMDAEIEALDGKLAKARAVKQGMMQELLTGRVRLV